MNPVPIFTTKALLDYKKEKDDKKAENARIARNELQRIKEWQDNLDPSSPRPSESPLPYVPGIYESQSEARRRKKKFLGLWKKKADKDDVDFGQIFGSPIAGPTFTEENRDSGQKEELTALPRLPMKRSDASAAGSRSDSKVGTIPTGLIMSNEEFTKALRSGKKPAQKAPAVPKRTEEPREKGENDEDDEEEKKKKRRVRKRLVKKVRKDGDTQSL